MLTPSLTLTEQVARQIAADIAQGVHPVGANCRPAACWPNSTASAPP